MADMPGESHRATPAEPLAGVLAQARRQAEAGDLTGARSALEAGLAAAEADLGQFHPDLTFAMVDLATIARELGNVTEAQRQLGRAHRILIAAVGRDHARTLAVEGRMARVNLELGDSTYGLDRHLADVGARVLGEDNAAVREARARLAAAGLSLPGSTPEQPAAPVIDLGGEPGNAANPSAWADAGEWSDPSGWSGAETPQHPDLGAGAGPYAPVPGAPGVFGLRPPGAPGPTPPDTGQHGADTGQQGADTGQRGANSSHWGVESSQWAAENSPWRAPGGQRPADPVPPDAPLYVPEQYDSGGWAAASANEETEPQHWPPSQRAGQSGAWAPPGWPAPAEPAWDARPSKGRRTMVVLLSIGGVMALSAGTVVAMQALPPSATGQRPGVVTAAPTSAPVSSAPAPTTRARSSAPPTTAASGPTPAVGGAPARLRITDDGTSVTLTWQDPSDGTVPFIVAGARSGAESHPMQSIPAGRTRSTIHGLNTKFDYCFTVAAVYSIDVVARSAQACTRRLSTAATP